MSTEKVAHAIREALEAFSVGADRDPEEALRRMEPLYDPGLTFQDPIQSFAGWNAFLEANRRIIARAQELRFSVAEVAWHLDQVFLTWTMTMRPKVGPTIRIDGVTHLKLRDGKIISHRDYWDLAGAVADALPIVGPVYHALMHRLG